MKRKYGLLVCIHCCTSYWITYYQNIFLFKVVYPKTDQQRERLNEAVKNILLFKNLERVSGNNL
jgi:hypothetical protein